jgi:exopolysaccharide biosynthesis polyprenyl glycosylphosphotransferase
VWARRVWGSRVALTRVGASSRLQSALEVVGPPVGERIPRWARRYALLLFVTDLVLITVAVAGAHLFSFGFASADLVLHDRLAYLETSYWVVTPLLIVAWISALTLYDTRDSRVIGLGASEYKRVFNATLTLFGVIAIFAFVLRLDPARGYIMIALPVGATLLILSRWLWRNWLVHRRLGGRFMLDTVVVGSEQTTGYLLDKLRRFPAAGYKPVGIVLVGPTAEDSRAEVHGLPIIGQVNEVPEAAARVHADQVIVTSSDYLPPHVVREISWGLESTSIRLAVAPAVTEVAGPRIHTRPVEGLPILSVEVPRFEGGRHATKSVFDWALAVAAILVALPFGVIIALLIALDGKGHIFFRQERVGKNGQVFPMMKFRTMVVNAEELLAEMDLEEHSDRDGPMFKMRSDPRVTPVGKWLRRFSLDELPQLLNVLRGDMAMVGPRPPLVSEVERYEKDVRRRLLVKPGITGPWQINGRADLSWQEGVRLDLYYVENWSLAGDLVLIFRTLGAVLKGRGAY